MNGTKSQRKSPLRVETGPRGGEKGTWKGQKKECDRDIGPRLRLLFLLRHATGSDPLQLPRPNIPPFGRDGNDRHANPPKGGEAVVENGNGEEEKEGYRMRTSRAQVEMTVVLIVIMVVARKMNIATRSAGILSTGLRRRVPRQDD